MNDALIINPPVNDHAQRSAAVMASGIIAILGSVITAIGVLIGVMGFLLSSAYPNRTAAIPGIRSMTITMMFFFFAVAVWGAFSGVGLIRLRNWARISVLTWAGITAPFCVLTIAFVAFMPTPPSPNPA